MLYLAFPTDLRDRYKKSEWLVYGKMVSETLFTAEDILVLSEWTIPDRMELVQTMYRVRQLGARVIFIGPSLSDTEDFKRQLCLMGVYDFAFFADEIVLGTIDHLIEHPRSPIDVKAYIDHGGDGLTQMPPVVDVYEEETVPDLLKQEVSSERKNIGGGGPLFRRSKDKGTSSQSNEEPNSSNGAVRRKFTWPNPRAVHIRIVGEPGCGKTFVAWNLAALCNQQELPTAVIEESLLPLVDWTDIKSGVHVYQDTPPKGYRVLLDTRPQMEQGRAQPDLVIAVTWPDKIRMERIGLKLHQEMIPMHQVCWVINGHDAGLPLPTLIDEGYIVLPHEPRQYAAMHMKRPLVELVASYSSLLSPIAARISDLFIQNSKGGKIEDVDAARV